MGDKSGVAMAEAIQRNTTLPYFRIDAYGTQMSDDGGMAMAGAIKQNATLLSFSIDVSLTQMGDEKPSNRICRSSFSTLGESVEF